MPVRISNTQRKVKVPLGSLRRAAEGALSSLGLRNAELSVLITGDRKMRALNRVFRGLDKTTDVLSFPMSGSGASGPGAAGGAAEGPPELLGDVVISATRALSQAGAAGRGLEEEMVFLLLHGILHIAGYDHETGPADRRRMERKQRELMALVRAG